MATASSLTNIQTQARPKSTYVFRTLARIKKNWQLYVLLALPVAWLLVFAYYPMYGAQIAFRDFLPGKPILQSEWIGLANFQRFFESPMFARLMKNTIGAFDLFAGGRVPDPDHPGAHAEPTAHRPLQAQRPDGQLRALLHLDGGHGRPDPAIPGSAARAGQSASTSAGLPAVLFMGSAEMFPSIYVWTDVWQYTGFSTIIYLAALTTVDPALHEAAVVDGANRLQRMWHIDIPGILPVIVTLFILNMGQVLNVGFEKTFLMQNPLNLATAEVISTYVYKVGLAGGIANFSYAAAIGLFNSVIGLILLVSANWASQRLTQKSLF